MITVMIAVNDNCYNRSTRLFALLFCQVYSGDTILIIAAYGRASPKKNWGTFTKCQYAIFSCCRICLLKQMTGLTLKTFCIFILNIPKRCPYGRFSVTKIAIFVFRLQFVLKMRVLHSLFYFKTG